MLVLNTKAPVITDPRQSKTSARAGVAPGLLLTLMDVYISSLIPIPLPSAARKSTYVGKMALNNKLFQEKKNKMPRKKDIHLIVLSLPTFSFCSRHSESLSNLGHHNPRQSKRHLAARQTWCPVAPRWPGVAGVPHQTPPKPLSSGPSRCPLLAVKATPRPTHSSACARMYGCLPT